MSLHNKTNRELFNKIKEESVVFLDQYGKFHKVYSNKDSEIALYETMYNYRTNEILPKITGKVTQEERELLTKNTLTPDISIMNDGYYTYWIEGVSSHPCTIYKLRMLNTFDFTTLEYSVYDYDFIGKRRVIPCFDISKITAKDYEVVVEYFKHREKDESLYKYLVDLFMDNSIDNVYEDLLNRINDIPRKRKPKLTEVKKKKINPQELYPQVFDVLKVIIDKAKPKLEEGFTLCEETLLEKCIDGIEIPEEHLGQINKRMHYVIRKEHGLSIFNFNNPSYSEETIAHFNLKRRSSVLLKQLGNEIREYNTKIHIVNRGITH